MMSMPIHVPKIVAWTPMKLNNERLPNKNTKPFTNGEPLCSYVLNTLLEIKRIEETYVFCSDPIIQDLLPNRVKYQPRGSELDTFSTKINDVCLAFTSAVEADIYVYAQVTSPFLTAQSVKEGLEKVMSGEYDSALTVKKLQDFLWKEEKPFNYDPGNIARTQDLEPFFQETGALYIYTRELMISHKRRTGFQPYLVEVSETEAIDIDYHEDFLLADAVFNYRQKQKP